MGMAEFLVPALAHELAVTDRHGADERVGLDVPAATLGQVQRPPHPEFVPGFRHGVYFIAAYAVAV